MKKKAFTLIEIIAVLAIIGIIIAGSAVGLNRSWHNSRIDTCESDLREMTTAFRNYLIDNGNIELEPDEEYETKITETVNTLNKEYMPYEIEIESIGTDKKSVCIKTKIKEDPWNNKYEIRVYTSPETSLSGLAVISSCGPDGKSNSDKYKDEDFGDDIIAVIEPKV